MEAKMSKYGWLAYPFMVAVAIFDIIDLGRRAYHADWLLRITLIGVMLLVVAAWHQFEIRRNRDPFTYVWMIALLIIAGVIH
jgi:hypothetical protein